MAGLFLAPKGLEAGVSEHQRTTQLLMAHQQVLELITTGVALPVVLAALVRLIEAFAPAVHGAIFRLDPVNHRWYQKAAPSLPAEYNCAVDGWALSEAVQPEPTSAFELSRLSGQDIRQAPQWADFRALAAQFGWQATWVTPILLRATQVGGSLILYYRTPRHPTKRELQVVDLAARLAALAIERAQSEKEGPESDEYFRLLADTAPAMLWVAGPDSRCTFVNKSWLKFTGCALEQMLGEGWQQGIHPEDLARCLTTYRTAFSDQQPFTVEYRHRRADDEYRWILTNGVPRYTPDAVFAGYVGSNLDITERKRDEKTRIELLRQLVSAQEDERRRVARELHDQMGQHLTGLMLGLENLKEQSQLPPSAAEPVERLQKQVDYLMQAVHHLAWELRPTALDDWGLETALRHYAKEWAQRTGLAVDFHSNGLQGARLPAPIETTIYRVVQEALTNVAKHAQARQASVLLTRSRQQISAIVEDDGQGFEAETIEQTCEIQNRLGLVGMQERVTLVRGTLTLESRPGAGTTIFVNIPLPGH